MRVSSTKFLNFISSPHPPPRPKSGGGGLPPPPPLGGEGASPLPAFRAGGRVGGADKVKKLAARDSHFLLNNFLIKNFGVYLP